MSEQGKQKMQVCGYREADDGSVVAFLYRDGAGEGSLEGGSVREYALADYEPPIIQRLAAYGLKMVGQRAHAGAESIPEAIEQHDARMESLAAGTWTTKRDGAGNVGALIVLAEALYRAVLADDTVADGDKFADAPSARAYVDTLDSGQRTKLRKQLAPMVAMVDHERAQKRAQDTAGDEIGSLAGIFEGQ